METYEKILKLEEAALAALADHRYDDSIRYHAEAIRLARALDRPALQAVLLNRLRLFDMLYLAAHRPIVAWSAGASMTVSCCTSGRGGSPRPRDCMSFEYGIP